MAASSSTEELSVWQSGILFRGRHINDVFLRRTGVLFGEVFMTYHSDEDKEPTRVWQITQACTAQDPIPCAFSVAEENWTSLGARLFRRTYTVDGFVIEMTWPEETLNAGGPLVLGFESEETAKVWQQDLTSIINSKGLDPSPFSSHKLPIGPDIPHEETSPCEMDPEGHLKPRSWQAIKEIDGMLVHYEENEEDGGAYMVSSIIKSHPNDCLEALTTGSFLFGCGDVSLVRREEDIEVLHLRLQPVGLGSWFLTPRELLIERLWTKNPEGSVVVLFKSCAELNSGSAPYQSWWSWFTKPIEAHIPAAGFTISPIEQADGRVVSLLTLVLKIDLGGVCSPSHPFKYVLDSLGICENWIDKILMTVSMLKQRLETQKPQIKGRSSNLADGFMPSLVQSFRRQSFRSEVENSAFVVRQDSLPRHNGVLNAKFWCNPGSEGFNIRGETYLEDKKKIPAEDPRFDLDWVYLVKLNAPTHNIAKFLPALRSGNNDFTFVLQVMIPGPPHLAMVIGWSRNQPSFLADHESESSNDNSTLDPFDTSLLRFIRSDDEERHGMFKLIPKVVEGNWLIRRSVGSTPVIMGRKLKQSYHTGLGYFELDIDISSSKTASAVIGIVQGATRKLTVDLAILIQGEKPEELPEALLGTVRLDHVDLETAIPLEQIIRT